MRKFTLILASLMMTVGALAQDGITFNTASYTVKSVNRGYLYYDSNNGDYVTSSSHTTLTDATPTGEVVEQFAFLSTDNTAEGECYMYSIAAEKFVTYTGKNGVALELTDNPSCTWTLVENGDYYVIKVPGTNNTCINITNWQAKFGCKVIGTAPDDGNKMTLTKVNSDVELGTALVKVNQFEGNYFATPETGKYYKIKGEGELPWLTADVTSGGNVVVSNDETKAAVFLKTANGLQAIATGKYLGYTGGKYTYSDAEITIELRNTGDYLANYSNKYAIVSGGNYMFNNNNDGIVHESNQALDLPRLWAFTEVENVVHIAGAGIEDNPYVIDNAEELILFRNSVNEGVANKYNAPGVWVALGADINLAGENWVGIGSATAAHGFMGNFDGKNFKIKNLTITDPVAADSDGYVYAGLFSVTEGTDKNNQNVIKNLTIENVNISTDGHIVSAAIAYPYYTIVDNVNVCGNIAIKGGDYTAGVLAYTRRCVNASNLSIVGNPNSYVTGEETIGGVISDIQMNGGLKAEYSNFSAEGISVTGTKSVGGISGIISQQTLNGASVKNVTLNCDDARVGVVAGSLGATSTITGVETENVTGASVIIGATYDHANVIEAKVGDTYYSTLADAVKAENDVTLLTAVTLKDDVAYASTSRKTVTGEITYTRNLIAGWNPIYLPFAVELSTEKYDVATFTSAEGETVTLTKIEDATATLAANTAYVIRPKNEAAKTLTIALTDATLEAATVNTQELGEGFSVKGNYSVLTGSKLGANDRVVGTNGDWGILKSTSTLKPYRLILTIPATAKSISMRVEGEDVTSIENLGITIEGDVIFDLMGRRVETMTEGGIYIVNGKKVIR